MADEGQELLFDWMLEHGDLIPFITLAPPQSKDQDEAMTEQFSALERIKRFRDSQIECSLPIPMPSKMASRTVLAPWPTALHFFLQNRVHRFQRSKLDRAVTICSQLVGLVLAADCNVVVHIDEGGLLRHLTSPSPATLRLAAADQRIIAKLSNGDYRGAGLEEQGRTLLQILQSARPAFDREQGYLGFVETSFDEWLISNYEVELERLLEKPARAVDAGSELMARVCQEMRVRDPIDQASSMTLFFRALFDYGYERGLGLSLGSVSRLRAVADRVQLADTGCSPAFLHRFDPSATMAEIVASEPGLRRAADQLLGACFCNSPFDRLRAVGAALTEIRGHIAEFDRESVQCFDVVFGLLLVTICGSDLPNPEAVFSSIDRWVSEGCLNANLDYARSTASAAAIQCSIIVAAVEARLRNQ